MRLLHLIILFAIFSLANYQTLSFYFWHDDFSSFYGPLVNQCIHGWPYYSFCTTFDWLVKTIGYTPLPYFLIGNVFGFFSVILFYLFINKLFNNKTLALGTAGLFASSYIAAGVFLEAWDPLISYITLSSLFVALIICLQSIQNGFKTKHFILATITLLISISLFHFRSSTNFIPFIALIILFSNKTISLRKRFILSVIILLLCLFTFFTLPLKILKHPIDSFYPSINVWATITNFNKLVYLFQTLSSFILPDYLHSFIPLNKIKSVQVLTGIMITLIFFIFSWFNRKNWRLTRISIFAVIWIISLFLPFWVRNDFYLNSTHRYILWLFPGVLLAWGTLFHKKIWLTITFLVIIVNVFQVHQFYAKHSLQSKLRQDFYRQLHQLLPTLPAGSILYFSYPPNIKATFDDYFRVGFTPSESALGTEFQVDYKTIQLITDSHHLRRHLQQYPFVKNSFYSFFYDGQLLSDTTYQTRELIGKVLSSQSTNQYLNQKQELEFHIEKFQSHLPSSLTLSITASFPKISLPYQQKCDGCTLSIIDRTHYLRYLTSASKVESEITIEAASASENTDDQNIIDNDTKTYWLFNRQLWHKDIKPQLNLRLTNPHELEGFILFGRYSAGLPNEVEVIINGQQIPTHLQKFTQGIKVLFNKEVVSDLTIKILKTDGNDTPVINEIDFIPSGFTTIDPLVSEQVRQFPVNRIESLSELTELKNYLNKGSRACLKWSNQYNQGEESFFILVDNTPQTYKIPVPALGPVQTTFTISCLNFPINLDLTSVQVSY